MCYTLSITNLKQILHLYVAKAYNGELQKEPQEFLADDFKVNLLSDNSTLNLSSLATEIEESKTGITTFHVNIDDIVEEGNRVAAILHFSGEKDGKRVIKKEMLIFHFSEGKFVEGWTSTSSWKRA